MQMNYFENLVNQIDSEEEEITDNEISVVPDEGDMTVLPDENNMTMQYTELNGNASDTEVEAHPVELGHGGDSENDFQSDDEMEAADMLVIGERSYFLAKDGTKWNRSTHGFQRMRKQNIFRESRFVGPNPNTKNMSITEIFYAIMHPTIQSIICRNTNRKGKAEYQELDKSTGNAG